MKSKLLLALLLYSAFSSSLICQSKSNIQQLSLYGALGYPYQSAGISTPLMSSDWHIQAHLTTDMGGIATKLRYPDHQFLGVVKFFDVTSALRLGAGAGLMTQFHTSSMNFGLSPMATAHLKALPLLDIGITITQPTHEKLQWNGSRTIVQASGLVHLSWNKSTNGLVYSRKGLDHSLTGIISTGIPYTSIGLEFNPYDGSAFAVRAQLFTNSGRWFKDEAPDQFQWLGGLYTYHLNEILLKAGIGAGAKFTSENFQLAPYILLSGGQKLFDGTYLIVDIWQATINSFNDRGMPFVMMGLSIQLN